MPRLDASFVAQATGAQLRGQAPAAPFAGVGSDSRAVRAGMLFVALKGPHFDGHDYVAKALEAGAAGALVARGFSLPQAPQACLLAVENTLTALGDLARAWRLAHAAPVAAITGSNGKTTTKEMLAAILGQDRQVLKTLGNLNNLIGLPLTALQLDQRHAACVLEMGMNAPGEIARLTEIAVPDLGLITNVGPAHLGPLGSLEAVALAKTELYRGLGPQATALVNLDDPLLAPWAQTLTCRVATFGLAEQAQVRGGDIAALGSRLAFSLHLPGQEPLRVRLAVPGRHNVLNALAAAGAAWVLGVAPQAIQAGLESFQPVKGRLQLSRGFFGFWVLDDTYNANPASLAAGLAALSDIAGTRAHALILGDMLELGPTSPQLHRQAGARAVEAGCRQVLAVGEQAVQVAAGAREAGLDPALALAFQDIRELIFHAQEALEEDEVVLVKGSRSMGMERVVKALLTGEVA